MLTYFLGHVSSCGANTCKNGGKCVSIGGKFHCKCSLEYGGQRCKQRKGKASSQVYRVYQKKVPPIEMKLLLEFECMINALMCKVQGLLFFDTPCRGGV